MIKFRNVVQRRDATLNRVPWYPEDIHGGAIRANFTIHGKHPEVTESDTLWSMWLQKLVTLKLLMRTKDGYYSRPRTNADLAHAYKRSRTRVSVCEQGVSHCRKTGIHRHKSVKGSSES